MAFFSSTEPPFRTKQHALDFQDLWGAWRLEFRLGRQTLFSARYTRVDQAFLLWGLLSISLFAIGQLLPLSWTTQAVAGSVLTVLGMIGMAALTLFWAKVESLAWLIHLWVGLMLLGVLLTDYGIWCGSSLILMHLCPLWLGISAMGYLITGSGLRSRAFLIIAGVHLGSICLLPLMATWQFLGTGIVIGGSLLLLAQVQWDMNSESDYLLLTEAQKAFNQQQLKLRLGDK